MTRGWLTPMGGPEPDLVELDPITAPAIPEFIRAAITHALDSTTGSETALAWGRYAYHSATRLWGDSHPDTIRVGRGYERVLRRQGLSFDALRIAATRHTVAVQAGDPVRELTARCSLALAFHRDGQCAEAADHIRIVLGQWQASPHGYGNATQVLISAAAIWAGCGHTTAAIALLCQHVAHLAPLGKAADATPRRAWRASPPPTRAGAPQAHPNPPATHILTATCGSASWTHPPRRTASAPQHRGHHDDN